MKLLRYLLASTVIALLFACGGDPTGPSPSPTTVSISPTSSILDALGASVQFTAQVRDQNGQTMTGQSVTWSSSSTSVATVSSGGLATAVAVGTTTISASAGSVSGTASLTVRQVPASFEIVSGDGQTGEVGTILPESLRVKLSDSNGNPIEGIAVTWTVSSGGGTLSAAEVDTDEEGIAEVQWTLGTTPGENAVTASVEGMDALTLTATAEFDVSGIWTASLSGTVFHGEDGTGQTTSITLTLVQSGTNVTGSESFTDTMGRSGSSAVSGTLIGNTLNLSSSDYDPQCGGRTVTGTATVTSTTPGSTMSISYVASPGGICPSLSAALTYTKQ